MDKQHGQQSRCSCCRRGFLGVVGATAGAAALHYSSVLAAEQTSETSGGNKERATVRVAFLYPPSETLRRPGAWWSWPGNDFDAEGRQRQYTRRLREIEQKLAMRLVIEDTPLHSDLGLTKFIGEVKQLKPDGLLLIPLHNPTFRQMNHIVDSVVAKPAGEGKPAESGIPTLIFSTLGVHHGSVKGYERPGLCFIQTLDDLEAVEYGLRMINTAWLMRHSRIISIAGAAEPSEARVPGLGTKVRRLPLEYFTDEVTRTEVTDAVKRLARSYRENAKAILEPAEPEIITAAKVHFACKRILETEQGDAIMIDCLRRGEFMPCMSFMTLRDEGIPAGCENDLGATLTLMLVQHLFERPGFQANPCYDTERNHFFASHCTSASKLFGTAGPQLPYLLRNYAHTNDPTCVPQVLWREGEEVTMAHYLPGNQPQMLVYTGSVVKSYEMPPVGGCRTNVAFTVNEHENVCDVKGHHNVVFCGNYGRQLRRFAQLYEIAAVT
jgi:hypothetical protein